MPNWSVKVKGDGLIPSPLYLMKGVTILNKVEQKLNEIEQKINDIKYLLDKVGERIDNSEKILNRMSDTLDQIKG
ncbi:hypothetical protein [Desulforamulus reducens]|uniref:hypothetical protein n=1 Tax=Desulforamulus reducens TaxID=59610 RepID=UPI0018DD497B|nr:hypothetical protein [Desulforamulus reducens]